MAINYKPKTVTVGGITYYEHDSSSRRRKREIEQGGKVSEPEFACPGCFKLTQKQIIDRCLANSK